ncbi:hypothetical protein EEJ42_05810 [Streptomyces botrytidirepellens]|uniref:Uncharacterized protein n=1 Tax=Streptomyces botrytidirepellens TaxID=2486417 RepID=A0A3M8WY47_9ACTN|nr:hypothetical protein [Streptomyces sp. NBRC 110028]RNG34324.1 hypothetical protein EEJ42_05810 [Streptomyces botrytidirepellens]
MIESHEVRVIRLTRPSHVRRVLAVRRTSDPSPFLNQAISMLQTAAATIDHRLTRSELPRAS